MMPLYWAASNGNTDVVRFPLENEADLNTSDGYGTTRLHSAAFQGNEELVRL
jgi:ankyrin repeat protein